MKKLLLVTLVHNRRELLGRCIQSAVNQTLDVKYWTHLIIDNASTDGADQVAEAFVKKYPHIVLVRNSSNLGQQPVYNWVLKEWLKDKPEYRYMSILDSDDTLNPIALDEVCKKFDANKKIGQTYSDFNIIDGKDRIKIKNHSKAKQVDPKIELTEQGQKILRAWELRFNVIGHLRSFRIEALKSVGGFDETYKYATDVNIGCSMLSSDYYVAKIIRTLYNWRDHGKDQVQGSDSPEQTRCWKEITKYYEEKWRAEGKI